MDGNYYPGKCSLCGSLLMFDVEVEPNSLYLVSPLCVSTNGVSRSQLCCHSFMSHFRQSCNGLTLNGVIYAILMSSLVYNFIL